MTCGARPEIERAVQTPVCIEPAAADEHLAIRLQCHRGHRIILSPALRFQTSIGIETRERSEVHGHAVATDEHFAICLHGDGTDQRTTLLGAKRNADEAQGLRRAQ